jgi:hypothetical protein
MWVQLQRLVFGFWKEKSPGGGRGFFCAFTGILRGGLENVGFWCGVFVVMLWWIRGELWLVEDCSVVG